MPDYRTKTLRNGKIHIYANDTIYQNFDQRVFQLANQNLQIPNIRFLSLTPDAHEATGACVGTTAVWDVEEGYISPSIVGSDIGCGIRVHLTPLHKEDLQSIKIRQRIMRNIERFVSTKESKASSYRNIKLNRILRDGLFGLPAKYQMDAQMFSHVEQAQFPCCEDVWDNIAPNKLRQAQQQIGTIGSGNHFIELQTVTISKKNQSIAKKWGIFDGQVIVMIHSGSRAWGKVIRPIYIQEFRQAMRRYTLPSTNNKMLYLPLTASESQYYLQWMYAALNYAVVNRHMIAFGVWQGLQKAFNRKLDMPVLYDLTHNYALEEEHGEQRVVVHRKGTTRSLPASHPMNPNVYRETGHPSFIPGAMGTSSYLMVGKSEGEHNYYSICHGAGRVFQGQDMRGLGSHLLSKTLQKEIKDKVVFNQWAFSSYQTEHPSMYKEINQIIASITGAGLVDVVAEGQPQIIIKAI